MIKDNQGKIIGLLFMIFTLGSLTAKAQQKVGGKVTDSKSGNTLPGVNIQVKGTTTGTATNAAGQYELDVQSLQDTLVFTFIGYQTREVSIDGQTAINIKMQPKTLTGEVMVVVGYGEEKKENLTGSISTVEGANISNQPSIQASSALQGKIAGVTVQENSGQPGSIADIKIRGVGTLNNSNPLVLVDGVPGNLRDVAPSNIASVTVLKDASSAAIYGSRAANGVVLVKTIRGREGGPIQVHYDGNAGWQQPTRLPDFVDGADYMKYRNIARKNVGRSPLYTQDYINQWKAKHTTDPDHYPNTDWIDAVFTEPGFQQKHHLSATGGSEIFQYLGSLSYDDQGSSIPNFNYKRYSIRLNTDVNISKQWHFSFDVNALKKDQIEPSVGLGLTLRQTFRLSPILVARYSDGSFGPGLRPRQPAAFVNKGGVHHHNANVFKSRLSARYNPVSDLELQLTYAPEYRGNFDKTLHKQFSIYDIDTRDLLYTTPSKSSISEQYRKTFNNYLSFTAKYQTDVNNHQFKVLGGYEFINQQYDTFSASRDQLSLQDFEEINVGALGNQQNSGTGSAYALQSVFGRFNYKYKSKYLFEADVRYDGSSRFAKTTRYGLFPSFSAGWILSNEPFLQEVQLLSNVKLRASWGQLGNQEIGTYPYQAVINLNQNYIFGGQPVSAAAQLDLANRQISWETTETADIGLDLGLWEDRLNFSFDYYQKRTNDILLRLPIPTFIGLNAPYQNAGNVKNTGWELSTSYQDNVGNFNYNLGFNISNVHNEVTDLHGAGPFINGNSIIKVGEPINAIYGYKADGYFDSEKEIDNSATQVGMIAPGDIKYVDQLTADTDGDGISDSEDGLINANDKVIIGDPFPRYSYSFNISAGYKGFSLSALLQGTGKKDVLLRGDAIYAFYEQGNMRKWQKDYWRPDNKDASYPRLVAGTTANNFRTSSFWVYNAAYLSLRNLRLGYTIPVRWTQKWGIKKFEIYFLGQNLFTGLDDMPPGVSPTTPNGTAGSYFPVNKVYTFGLNLNF